MPEVSRSCLTKSTICRYYDINTRTDGKQTGDKMAYPIKVLIVDDHLIVRKGITSILEIVDDIDVVGEASNAGEALVKMKELHPDIVLVDLRMPGMDGIELTRLITARFPASKVIILTLFDQYLSEAIKAGAKGYILKELNLERLVDAIERVNSGQEAYDPELQHTIDIEYEDTANVTPDAVDDTETTETFTGVSIYDQLRVFILPPASISGSLSLTSIIEEAVKGEFRQVEGTVSDGFAITFDLQKPLSKKEIKDKVSDIGYIQIPGEKELTENPDFRDLIPKQNSYDAKHPMVRTVFIRLV